MFEPSQTWSRDTFAPADGTSVPGLTDVETWISGLADPALSDAERVDRIRALEDLKAAPLGRHRLELAV